MKKYTTRWIIALLSLALIGLLCVQLYWVDNAVALKRELFRQSVNGAISAVVSKLEKREVTSAVARTVYAAASQPRDTVHAVPKTTPAPVPQRASAPAEPVTAQRPSATLPTSPPAAQGQTVLATGTLQSSPIVISSQRPSGSYSFTAAQGGYFNSNPTVRIVEESSIPIQLVHLDSIRNIMHLHLDTSITRQRQFLQQQVSMPRIAVNRGRDRGNARQHSVTVHTEWQQDTALVQLRKLPRAFGRNLEVNVSVPELERRIEHIQTMVSEIFDESVVVELGESFPPTSSIGSTWAMSSRVQPCGHSHTDSEAPNCSEIQNNAAQGRIRLAISTTTEPGGTATGSYTATATAPERKRTRATHDEQPSPAAADAQKSDLDKLVTIKDMASRVVTELATGLRPIAERVSTDLLDSLLRSELAQRGVTLPYRYAVLSQQDSFALATPAAYTTELKQSAFRAALYPNDIITEPYFLSVYFPGQDEFVYESMWGVLGTSLLFILLILGCFSFTLITLIRQKKLSDMKTDFINNMTHELKTPIATISLASEALRDPAVRSSDNRVMRFINAIFEENKRLGSQVERVLQAAVIDRGEVRISPATVCVHDILKQALQTIALQVESRGGTIECHFDAERDCIQADRVHLANIIVNLLDNANKYSPDSPRIVLSTSNTGSGVIISVEDNGIGMSRDAQKRIFEQFYRVSTGNLHDVKGFGLGLSYVKAMVEAHGGTISVRSELRQGSRFELYLPFAGKEMVHT